MEPEKGSIAYCSAGALGLITSERMEETTYHDGNTGLAWKGIQLKACTIREQGGDGGKTFTVKPGDPWSSRQPLVVGHVDDYDIVRRLMQSSEPAYPQGPAKPGHHAYA